MTTLRPVIGIFDDTTDAQQAVQRLLSGGSPPDSLEVDAQSVPEVRVRVQQQKSRGRATSGRSFASLYGDSDQRIGTLVTIRVQPATEAERTVDLRNRAGAAPVN